MDIVSLPAHFDGVQIRLDAPYPLEANMKLLVTVVPVDPPSENEDREAWLNLSAQRLQDAYADEEPEYPLTAVREMNPHYEAKL